MPTSPIVPVGDTFVAYTDGACLGNPGKGGWAYLIQVASFSASWDGCRTGSGSAIHTTNNRMELAAAYECLRALGPGDCGVIHCDSQYVVKGVNEWRKGWEKKRFSGVANAEVWQALLAERDRRPAVRFAWVKGHADSDLNNRVDEMANTAARLQSQETYGGEPEAPTDSPTARAVAQIMLETAERLAMLPPAAEPALQRALAYFGDDTRALPSFLTDHCPAFGMTWLAMLEGGHYDSFIELIATLEGGAYI